MVSIFNTLITKIFVRRGIHEVMTFFVTPRNLVPLLVGRCTEVLKDHVDKKYFFSLYESKTKYGFKNTERWNVVKMSNDVIPSSNCVGKETTHVPQ